MPFTQDNLSTDFQEFIDKLNNLDLDPLAYKLMYSTDSKRLSEIEVTQAINQYLMFLTLIYLYPNHQLVPSQIVDRVWHCHITDTLKYAQDTQMLFGRFIHHYPYSGHCGKVDSLNQKLAFIQTNMLLEKHFGIENCGINGSQKPADCQPIGEKTNLIRPNTEIDFPDISLLVKS